MLEPTSEGVSPYSTAPAPPTPFVVRIELSIVDDKIRLVGPIETAHAAGPSELAVEVTAEADEQFTPRHPAFEPRGPVPPAPPVETAWIEPTGAAHFDEQSGWPDQASESQPLSQQQSQPAPWDEPAAPLQTFAEATDVPPWAPARAAEPAAAPAPASLAPQTAEFAPAPAPAPAPVADPAPAPFEEPAPRWAQPTYDAQPLAQAPVAREPAPSPFAPAPVAGAYAQPVYAEPMYIDPLPASAPPITGERADAAPQLATVAAQDQSDLWFLSTEPSDGEGAEARHEVVEGKEPSALLTGILTIGMAVLVIVLVLVFIQLMTSLLR
jgi:hypothetical protein